MMDEFEMSDLGQMKYFLGIEVKQTEAGNFIGQEGYAKDILKRFRMDDAHPMATPMETGLKLSKKDEGKVVMMDYTEVWSAA